MIFNNSKTKLLHITLNMTVLFESWY